MRGLRASSMIAVALSITLASFADAQDASSGDAPSSATTGRAGASSDDGVVEHGGAHTTSSTTTRSGPAPSSTGPDGASEPVVDPVTDPAQAGATGTGARATSGAEAEEEEDEGDGRDIDFIWIEAQGGISNVNLVQFQNQNFADVAAGASVFDEVYGTGPVVGLGAGFRIYWLAVGARASFAVYETFQIGTIGAELTLRLPVPIVEPWIRAGFGYGWQGDANYQAGVTTRDTTTYGWVFQAGIGVDIYLVNWLTIGAGFGLDVLNMTRQRDPTVACMGVVDVCPGMNGDALGLQLKGLVTVGLRF